MLEPTVHVYRRARSVARAALTEEPALTEPTTRIQRRMVDAVVEAVWPIAFAEGVAAGRKESADAIRAEVANVPNLRIWEADTSTVVDYCARIAEGGEPRG